MDTPRSTAPENPSPRRGKAELLDALLSAFSRRLGADRYEVWFRNAARVRIDADGRVAVGVPNPFIGRFLDERCGRLLRECAAEIVGDSAQVIFDVDAAAFPAKPQAGGPAPTEVASGRSPVVVRMRSVRKWLTAAAPPGRRCDLSEFVVGPGNRLAHAAAVRVSERPGAAFNPLFIHGKVGLGKTHLLLGVVAALAAQRPDLEAVYTSAEEFTNLFLSAMKAGDLERFRRDVRSLDVLILDDVHFLAKKHATQEEFLHTFNSIASEGRQIVLASDSPPHELAEFNARLLNRFVQGMVTCLEPPDFATRRNILVAKAARAGRKLPDDVLDYLADVAPPNVRELEGGLTRLLASVDLAGRPLDVRTAAELFGGPSNAPRVGPPVVARIEQAVADLFGVKPSELAGGRRGNGLNVARQMLMYLLRERTGWTLQQIADHLGRKNHTTVLSGHRRMQEALDADLQLPLPGFPRGALPGARGVMARLEEALDGKPGPAGRQAGG